MPMATIISDKEDTPVLLLMALSKYSFMFLINLIVIQGRLELPAYGLGNHCSIQLSY